MVMKNSLLEFTELLKNRSTDLLFEESGNDKYIYLYLADGYWTAFEKSAYRLYRIYEPVMLLPIRLPFTPFPIVTASVKKDSLYAAIRGLTCRKRSKHERIYVDERNISIIAYQKWHDRVTDGLRSLSGKAMND
jgi:hypothetical protein